MVVALVVLAVVGAIWAAWTSMGPSTAAAQSGRMIYICAETGKSFDFKIEAGMKIPVPSPHSGKNTGYPAELCYWTKDGKPSESPTPVLMNDYVNKPGPTFCPDCGRLVRFRNPMPSEGSAPPTREQYAQQRNHEE